MTVQIIVGDVRECLRRLPDCSVSMVCTSPPYWGLRDYGVAGQIGLESSPWFYLAVMVDVFREVRRVLKPEGVVFLNMGDSYVGARRGGDSTVGSGLEGSTAGQEKARDARNMMTDSRRRDDEAIPRSDMRVAGLKEKDMLGMPWRLAFRLQEDGWWLRQEIIWAKPNPMPESARDRCTKAHEHIFLLTKSKRYYWNYEAAQEPATYAEEAKYDNGENGHGGGISHAGQGSSTRKFKKSGAVPSGWDTGEGGHRKLDGRYPNNGVGWGYAINEKPRTSGNLQRKPGSARGCPEGTGSHVNGSVPWEGVTRNKRSVWTIPTHPYAEAHFATFPTELARLCVEIGCPEHGTVLDPFGGAGTVGLVADRLQRNAILIELNPTYAELARKRIFSDAPLFAEVT